MNARFDTELMGTFDTELIGTFDIELMGAFHLVDRLNYGKT